MACRCVRPPQRRGLGAALLARQNLSSRPADEAVVLRRTGLTMSLTLVEVDEPYNPSSRGDKDTVRSQLSDHYDADEIRGAWFCSGYTRGNRGSGERSPEAGLCSLVPGTASNGVASHRSGPPTSLGEWTRCGRSSQLDRVGFLDAQQADHVSGAHRPDNPACIVRLIGKVIGVSVESVNVVDSLPAWPDSAHTPGMEALGRPDFRRNSQTETFDTDFLDMDRGQEADSVRPRDETLGGRSRRRYP